MMPHLTVLAMVASLLLLPAAVLSHEGPHEGYRLAISVSPSEPQNFQPAHMNEQARIKVQFLDAEGDAIQDALIEVEVKHLAGRGIISTGFHHMEGKTTWRGKFFAPGGELDMRYIFPIRGNYLLKARAMSALPQPAFEPVEEVAYVHVKEPFFEVRNAAALVFLLLALGVVIGRIYGKAGASAHGL